MAVLAVDVGGTRTRALLVPDRPDGDLRAPPPEPVEMAVRAAGQPLLSGDLLDFLDRYCSAAALPVEAVGVSVAGLLDDQRRTVQRALNVGWRDEPLWTALHSRFRCPVVLETDAFAAAHAELRLGAGRRHATFVYVTIGTGIGHALVLEGRVWRGVRGAACTFGHLKTHADAGDAAACACGGEGCLCQYASGRGMAQLARRHHDDRRPRDGAAIVTAAARGEPWARRVMETANDALALALSHALTLVDCGTVIIGGGAVSDLWPDPARLRQQVQERLHPQVRVTEIAISHVPHTALLGAALEAFDLVPDRGEGRSEEEQVDE